MKIFGLSLLAVLAFSFSANAMDPECADHGAKISNLEKQKDVLEGAWNKCKGMAGKSAMVERCMGGEIAAIQLKLDNAHKKDHQCDAAYGRNKGSGTPAAAKGKGG